ncbi:MAG: hypothetical protein R3A79_23330 [Nannocystaceae bacterium]
MTARGRDAGGDAALRPAVLVVGGVHDPNLDPLLRALARLGVDHRALRVGEGLAPAITWALDDDRLTIDGELVAPAGVFIRYDVFGHLRDRREATAFRANAWYTTIAGWLAAHPEVRWLGRAGMLRHTNKLHALGLARAAGLEIPATRVTNELAALVADGEARVAKPVAGGGYCERLGDLLAETAVVGGVAAAPAIVQPELVPPELRIYGVRHDLGRSGGGPASFFAFEVIADDLDYRRDRAATIEPRPVPEALAAGVLRVMDSLGLDFAAADFKADPATGRPLFLEINSGPMFVAFDRAAEGALTGALARALAGLPAAAPVA